MAFSVSVVIPAYNSEMHIGRAIDSVLGQSRPADEIIVIDDGSADGTAEIVKAYGDKVRYIYQENAGVSVARNKGIDAANGEWIAFLDADDEWIEGKLEAQAELVKNNPDLKWTYSNYYFDRPGNDELVPAHRSKTLLDLAGGKSYFEDYLTAYVNNGHASTCALMIKKSIFEEVGLFKPGLKRAQDNDLWFRISYQEPKIGYISSPLFIYHLDTPGSSTKINDEVDYLIEFIDRHVELSAKYGRTEAFRLCATHMLTVRIRRLFEQNRFDEARILLGRFVDYLPDRFKREMKFRLVWPPLTNRIGDMVMELKKVLK